MSDHDISTRRLVRGLGLASLGLGLVEVALPRAVSRLSGVGGSPAARALVPVAGARELANAAGLLSGRRPAAWIWARVAGDVMDLALLGWAVRGRHGAARRRTAATAAAVAAVAAADLYAATRATRSEATIMGDELHLTASITVNRPVDEVYRFWRDFEHLPEFMIHLVSVRATGERRSHWTAKAPGGRTVQWDAQLVEDRPGELLAWRSLDGADVRNVGSVRFTGAPGGRGTEVRVELAFAPPAGRLGAAVARLLGEHPNQQIRDDLRRFKQVLETGEVLVSEGSPQGTEAGRQARQQPAQPVAAER